MKSDLISMLREVDCETRDKFLHSTNLNNRENLDLYRTGAIEISQIPSGRLLSNSEEKYKKVNPLLTYRNPYGRDEIQVSKLFNLELSELGKIFLEILGDPILLPEYSIDTRKYLHIAIKELDKLIEEQFSSALELYSKKNKAFGFSYPQASGDNIFNKQNRYQNRNRTL